MISIDLSNKFYFGKRKSLENIGLNVEKLLMIIKFGEK